MVGRKGTGTLVVVGIQSAIYGFGLGPMATVVLLRYEYVACLGASDAAEFRTLSLVAGRSEVQAVVLVAGENGRVVGAS